MAIPIDLDEEAEFWGARFAEHAQLTEQALEDPAFDALASGLARSAAVRGAAGPWSVADAARLARQLVALHTSVLESVSRGQWEGWAFPSLLSHMVREQQWFLGMLQGPPSVRDLICFGTRDAGEGAAVGAKLTDPCADGVERALAAQGARLLGIHDVCRGAPLPRLCTRSLQQVTALDTLVTSPAVARAPSVAPPGLLAHELAEARHFATLLRRAQAAGLTATG